METFKPVTIGVVSPDGKFTSVKRDDRQPLPPEVAEAIAALDAMTYAGSRTHAHWSCVKDHLRHLAEENARLRSENEALDELSKDVPLTVACGRKPRPNARKKAEAERDALKARIAEAPVVTVRDVYAIAAFPFTRIDAATMDRPVRLLVEDGERE